MNIHESYVSLETAKLLKEAGFDWEVNHNYPNCNSLDNSCSGYMEDLPFYHNLNDGKYGGMSAPTLEVAQRWLREVKLVSVESQVVKWFNRNQDNKCTIFWKYSIQTIDTNSQESFNKTVIVGLEFNSYEEALEAGIQKCLTIILERNDSRTT